MNAGHRSRAGAGTLLAVAAMLSACASPPPPLVSLNARNCVGEPDLSTAQELLVDPDKAVTVKPDATTACVELAPGSRSVYYAFRLKQGPDPYMISVTSAPLGEGIFAPRLVLLDAQGKATREIGAKAFTYHNTSLYTAVRWHPGESFLIVASDPEAIGNESARIVTQTKATTATAVSPGLFVAFTIHTGSESTVHTTFAHNGSVTIQARPVP